MNTLPRLLTAATMLVATALGCSHNDGRVRPPVDELSDNGRGLQGKDVVTASDQMAQEICSLPELNQSGTQWLIVVDRVDNASSMPRQNFDIFLQRLRVNLGKYGRGRVQLVENRDKLRDLQSRELEGAPTDPFGQGGVNRSAPGPAGIQPNLSLYAQISDLPSRETNYVNIRFSLTDLRNRLSVWDGMYEVAVRR